MKTIFLDMYGVLIQESTSDFISYAKLHFPNLDVNQLNQSLDEAKIGKKTSKQLFRETGFGDWSEAQVEYLSRFTFDFTFYSLAELYYNRIQYALLSNDVTEWSQFIRNTYGLNEILSTCIISGDVGYRKPQEDIFRLALNIVGKPPEECIFVDNQLVNLNTARNLGFKTILFDRYNKYNDIDKVHSFDELKFIIERELNE